MRPLTKQQMLIMLMHCARGLRAQDIAEIEHLSVHSVNNRLKRVKAIMECETTTEAVIKAIADGEIVVYRSPKTGDIIVRLKGEDN